MEDIVYKLENSNKNYLHQVLTEAGGRIGFVPKYPAFDFNYPTFVPCREPRVDYEYFKNNIEVRNIDGNVITYGIDNYGITGSIKIRLRIEFVYDYTGKLKTDKVHLCGTRFDSHVSTKRLKRYFDSRIQKDIIKGCL